MWNKISIFISTVKDLKIRQIYHFFLYFLKKKEFNFNKFTKKKYSFRKNRKPFFLIKDNSLDLKKKTFSFGLITKKVNFNNWSYNSPNLLWEYNLFYFDFLFSRKFISNKSLCLKLINKCIIISYLKKKHTMWDAYPTSMRLINLIKFCIFHNINSYKINESIFNHIEHLKKNLEYRLDANHLLTNLIAINFGNLFLKSEDNTSLEYNKILFNEIKIQFENYLHYEKTPSYHNLLTEKLIEYIIVKKYLKIKISNNEYLLIKNLINTSKNFSHPDNYPVFFNDTNFDCLNFKQLEKLFKTNFKKINFSFSEKQLDRSFLVLKNKKIFLISKCCGPNPVFNPGHSHADVLSFEVSLNNKRFIINKGISTYSDIKQRNKERSTKSHNCLYINDENSSQIWSLFRIGKKSKIKELNINLKKKIIECSHDGFSKIFKNILHKRKWNIISNKIFIDDKIIGYSGDFFLNFNFSPAVKLFYKNNQSVSFKIGQSYGLIYFSNSKKISIKNSFYYPKFGYKKRMKSLIIECNGLKNRTEIIVKK